MAVEPRTLVPSIGSDGAGPAEHLFEVVHQSLMTYDARGQPIPRVARALPSLEEGTWRLYPDGTMDTVWQLRDTVRWHDGRPLTAADVVFGWRVFNSTAVPVVSRRVARLIESIESPDPTTVVMRWRSRYAFANQLSGFDLALLPSHLLEATFELRPQQLAGHPYWQASFVGLGPYRLARWIAGSSLELQPFGDYFLGAPRAGSISVRFLPDDNVAMAAALAGDVDIVLPRRAGLGIIRAVRQQWAQTGDGALALLPGYAWAFLSPQFLTPQPEDLREVNVRRALSHALDRPAIAEAIAGDASFAAELWVPNGDPRAGLLAGAGSRHTYSPDRTQELLRETGWRREGADDALVKQGQRFDLELTATSEWYPVATLVADYWRRVGVVVKEAVVSLGSVFDRQGRSTYPGVELAAGTPNLALLDGRLRAANVPAVENFWVGANRGRYSSGEMEKALDRLWQALDPAELATAEGELARRISTELPILGVLFYPAMTMVRRGARNVVPPETVSPVGRLLLTWNAHEWEKS